MLKFLFFLICLASLSHSTTTNEDDLEVIDETEECSSCQATSSRDEQSKLSNDKKKEKTSPHLNEQMPYAEFPELNEYQDSAYESIKEIPSEIRNNLMKTNGFGCGVVKIKNGVFWMGSEDDESYKDDGESPFRKIKISKDFYIDKCQTEAEKYGWSFVFDLLVSKEVSNEINNAVQNAPWWIPVPKADFRHPFGPDRNFNNMLNHPVVHIGWTDAIKYCKFRGGRLPFEAEWEYACRGGLEKKKFPWGNDMYPNNSNNNNDKLNYMMNIFTGTPYSFDDGKDGFNATAPVGSFHPNGYGLYDCTGNVWEWVWDFFTARPILPEKNKRLRDPKGPTSGRDHVMKGGSYMCHQTTCRRYRCAGRSHAEPDSSTGNLGFRCVYDSMPNISNL
ncbi:sulfatase-modifying factor 1 precursor [Reticulomyxa filosa]|uniref:Sulfatase-modifying factor 1 n=1 Tax=Reticulomyxa filosa TaxID=46433 RepID=X6P0Q1_RETFI|nr:sulfatase-modifying factor 1 precursor [Reticulomyxa filosa]|eukprot:ETO31112.1 sulfatase-modifying factor 1 precursor [Reticulomyxa filosa]